MIPGGLISTMLGGGDLVFVNYSSVYSISGTTSTINVPVETQTGDIMIAFAFHRYPNTTCTAPSGWSMDASSNSGEPNSVFIFTKVAASEPSSYDFVFSDMPIEHRSIVMLIYRNTYGSGLHGTIGPIFRSSSFLFNATAPSITSTKPGTLIAFFASEDSGGGSISTPPAGMIERATRLGSYANIRVYDLLNDPPGTTGDKVLWWTARSSVDGVLFKLFQ